MTRRIPWIENPPRIETMMPRFVKAFDGSRFKLPMEIWLEVEDWIKICFKNKCAAFEEKANFVVFDQLNHEDYTERVFAERAKLGRLLTWHVDSDERRVMILYINYGAILRSREETLRQLIREVYSQLQ